MTVGTSPLVVVRGHDGEIRALHNVCRHRGSIVCEATHGVARRRFVCPYHQWSYELDGRLAKARSIADDVDTGELGLARRAAAGRRADLRERRRPPPDFGPLRELVEPYLGAFALESAKVAYETTAVEHGNWKLVLENNRECFHCRSAHPELCPTFPDGTQHSGTGTAEELRALVEFVDRCETLGLPSRFRPRPTGSTAPCACRWSTGALDDEGRRACGRAAPRLARERRHRRRRTSAMCCCTTTRRRGTTSWPITRSRSGSCPSVPRPPSSGPRGSSLAMP